MKRYNLCVANYKKTRLYVAYFVITFINWLLQSGTDYLVIKTEVCITNVFSNVV